MSECFPTITHFPFSCWLLPDSMAHTIYRYTYTLNISQWLNDKRHCWRHWAKVDGIQKPIVNFKSNELHSVPSKKPVHAIHLGRLDYGISIVFRPVFCVRYEDWRCFDWFQMTAYNEHFAPVELQMPLTTHHRHRCINTTGIVSKQTRIYIRFLSCCRVDYRRWMSDKNTEPSYTWKSHVYRAATGTRQKCRTKTVSTKESERATKNLAEN